MDLEEERSRESGVAEERGQEANPVQEEAEGPEDPRRALGEEKARAESYLANWQRTQADLSNFKRRIGQERSEAARYAGAPVLASLLPVIDDLERALISMPVQLFTLTWVDGIRLIYRKLLAALESHGVQQVPALDQDFDPHYHQSVMRGAGPEGKVVAEFQSGYRLYDRVLRPSLVQVGDGSGEAASGSVEAEEPGESSEATASTGQSSPTPDDEQSPAA